VTVEGGEGVGGVGFEVFCSSCSGCGCVLHGGGREVAFVRRSGSEWGEVLVGGKGGFGGLDGGTEGYWCVGI